jgi:hypothetical protein
MGFWTDNTTEPKRNFRWRVTMSNISNYPGVDNQVVWWAKTVDTPSYTVTDVTHSFFDNEYKFPGRVQWQDVAMTLVDPISPNAVYITNQIILSSGYTIKPLTGVGGNAFQPGGQAAANNNNISTNPRSLTKSGSNAAVGTMVIDIFSGNGVVVESWQMNNPFITSVKFSTLDYTNDDMRTIDLTWKYDWATCTSKTIEDKGYNGDGTQFKV